MYWYYKAHPSEITPYLMAWAQDKDGNDIGGTDSATDGDIDIAYGLLLADKQWGSSGDINYLQAAKNMIDAIMKGDVNKQQWTLMVGDWAPDDNPVYDKSLGTRSSDFILNHLRAFKNVAANDAQKQKWQNVIDKTYQVYHEMYNNYSPNTGLYPDFIDKKSGVYQPAEPYYLEAHGDGDYSYNACRTPWRLATDYLLSNETPDYSLTQLQTLNNWIKGSITNGDPSNIKEGYTLTGTALNNYKDNTAFIAPLGVSAMVDASNQVWLNSIWNRLATKTTPQGYYPDTIALLCMMVMSGNWWLP